MGENIQKMNDMVFSFGELGFQEFETSKYLTEILRQNGFTITNGIAGIPTAWTAKWGTGKPVIALGSDIDDIPQASQKPGVAFHDPIIEGAPGHGEGHNSGMPLQIAAALAVKKVMEQQHLQGTLMLWPGVAEELLGAFDDPRIVRASVNNGGDIALRLSPGASFEVGLVADPVRGLAALPLDGRFAIDGHSPVRGVATSGWRGRSFSLGIADSVTVLAASAAVADAAATVIANAVDVDDARIVRCPASAIRGQARRAEKQRSGAHRHACLPRAAVQGAVCSLRPVRLSALRVLGRVADQVQDCQLRQRRWAGAVVPAA